MLHGKDSSSERRRERPAKQKERGRGKTKSTSDWVYWVARGSAVGAHGRTYTSTCDISIALQDGVPSR
jgi:hypothetical protein